MKPEQLIEATLFISPGPVNLVMLVELTGKSRGEVGKIMEGLKASYKNRDSAIEIREIGHDSFMMQAKEVFSELLGDMVKPDISENALKTLSMIALKQPIMQSDVVKARGQSVYMQIKELVNKGFIMSVPAGRTKALTTTEKFADYFGFSRDVPELKKKIGTLLEDK